MIYNDSPTLPTLTYAQRIIELRENPVLACRAFKARLDNIIKYIWQGKYQPIGKLQDFWVRIESQNRGSLHAHIILWCILYFLKKKLTGEELTSLTSGDYAFLDKVTDEELKAIINERLNIHTTGGMSSPLSQDNDIKHELQSVGASDTESNTESDTESDNAESRKKFKLLKLKLKESRSIVAEIASQYVTANIPTGFEDVNTPISQDSDDHSSLQTFEYNGDDDEFLQDLRGMMLSVQMHDENHRSTCWKKGNFCRFYFPRPLSDKTELKFVKLKGI